MRLAAAWLAAAAWTAGGAHAQSPLRDVAVLSPHLGDATIPAVSAEGVAFRDYRAGAYGVYYVDLQTGQERRLAPVFYAEPTVATSAGRVAWVGYVGGTQADVYVHTLRTGLTTRLTADAAFQNHPRLHGDLLVWQDFRNAGSAGTNADLYAHDFTTGRTAPVTTHPALQDLPAVWGRRVAWQDYRHAQAFEAADVYVRDLDAGVERRLTAGAAYRTHPAIWEHRVVWEDYRHGANGDIYLFDLDTGVERAVCTHPAHQTMPAVWGDWVVWLDYRNDPHRGDLYGYHLATEQEHALLVHPDHQEPARVFGGTAVWQDYRNGRLDLYRGTLDALPTAAEPSPGALVPRLRAFPNPFRSGVTFEGGGGPPAVLEVFDALGRLVRRVEGGGGRFTWGGDDEAGRPLPGGVYVARLGAESVTVLLVRTH